MKESRETQRMYIDKITSMCNMKDATVTSHKCIRNCTYEELYLDFKERLEVLQKAQELFIEVKPRQLGKLKEFRNGNPSRRNEFLRNLYVIREQIPPYNFVNKVKRVLKQWENQADICRSCIKYQKGFCLYFESYVEEDFYCKALEKNEDL